MATAFMKGIEVEGWGAATRLELTTVSEDGRQIEFVGTYLKEEDAKEVAAFWEASAANRRMAHLIANLEMPGFDDQY